MKEVFTLKPEYEKYFNDRFDSIGYNYHLFHYRLGDNVMNNGEKIKNIKFCVDHFMNYKKENSFLISDSLEFKENIANLASNGVKGVTVLLNKPVHSNSIMVDKSKKTEQDYTDLIFDFLLIKNAKTISSYSIYDWTSNFVFWTSMIYGVPLTVLPNSCYIKNL